MKDPVSKKLKRAIEGDTGLHNRMYTLVYVHAHEHAHTHKKYIYTKQCKLLNLTLDLLNQKLWGELTVCVRQFHGGLGAVLEFENHCFSWLSHPTKQTPAGTWHFPGSIPCSWCHMWTQLHLLGLMGSPL